MPSGLWSMIVIPLETFQKYIREKYKVYYEKQIAICEAHGGDRRRVEVRILHCFFFYF